MNAKLVSILRGHVCLVGVGNRLKGDDAFGPLLVERLDGKISCTCIDAGVAPENYLEKIVLSGAETVLLVDAADFGAAPGELRVFEPNRLSDGGLSTHALSLGMAAEYLAQRGNNRVFLLAVQPRGIALGQPLSSPVATALKSLEDWFIARYGVDK